MSQKRKRILNNNDTESESLSNIDNLLCNEMEDKRLNYFSSSGEPKELDTSDKVISNLNLSRKETSFLRIEFR